MNERQVASSRLGMSGASSPRCAPESSTLEQLTPPENSGTDARPKDTAPKHARFYDLAVPKPAYGLANMSLQRIASTKQLGLDEQKKQLEAQARAYVDPKHQKIAITFLLAMGAILAWSIYLLVDSIIDSESNPPVRIDPHVSFSVAV